MKRKLTAVLLTLCMVLGMLPMSAFAYWTVGGTNVEPSDIKNGTFTVDGTTYYVKGTVKEGDALVYYATADATEGTTVQWTEPAGEHKHNLTKVDAVPPTCSQDGTIEYWTCDGTDCAGKYFDADGNELASIVDPATGEHTENAVDNKNGTHTVTCSVCNKAIVENEKHTFENGKCTVCEAVDPASIPTEKVEATVDEATGKVNVAVNITEQEASAAVDAAVGAAGTGETAVVTIPAVTDTSAEVKEVAVPIPETLVTAIADKAVAVAVETNLGKVSVPSEAFAGETGVTLTVSTNEKAEIKAAEAAADADESVTAEAVEAVKTAPVISIDLTNAAGDKLASKDNAPTAKIEIDIAVTVPSGWQKAAMWWVDHVDGKISSMKKIASVVDGRVKATLDHLSDYVLLEDTTEEPPVDENGYYSLTVTQVAGANIVVKCDGETDENGYYKAGSTVTGTVTLAADEEIKSATLSDGTEVTIDGANISFVMPAADVTLTVEVGKKASADELEVDIDTSDDKLVSYDVKGLTAGQTFAFYIQNADGKKVTSGSFVIASDHFEQAVEKGFTYRVWTIDDTVTAVQIWNGDVDGTKYTGYYDSNPEEL